MFKSSFVESQSFFNQYVKQQMLNKKKEQSGVVQCQRCLKYGHYTYECKNDVTYVYRPSRTMQYKEKHLQQQLNSDKAPDVPQAWDGDRNRTMFVRQEDEELSVVSSDSSSVIKEVVKGTHNGFMAAEDSSSESSSSDSESSDSSDSSDSDNSEDSAELKKKLQKLKAKEQQTKKDSEKKKPVKKEEPVSKLKPTVNKKREMKPDKPVPVPKKKEEKRRSRSRSQHKKRK